VAVESAPLEAVSDDVTVVATATKLSDAARRRLSDELGPGYIVLDLLKAPTTADVVLTHPVSPQLLGSLRASFPNARVIVTEIDDEELGVSHPGPVSRLLDAGASAYLPPRPLREVASSIHAYLTGSDAPQLIAASPTTAPTAALPSPPSHQPE
jgi:DNA-binding NarL/FixJ family response regulator